MIQDYFFVILGNQWQFQLVFSAIQISYFYLLQQSFTIVDYHFMQAQHLAPNNSKKNHSTETLNSILKNIAEKSLKITYQQLENMLAKPQIDRMLGCLYGAFLADSLGSFCQFKSKANCMKLSKSAMQMPGGGPFMLHPGQITDDSELALHMLAGLLAYDSKISLDTQLHILLVSIAKQYIQWWKNIPFDIGFTCRAAIVKLESHLAPYQELSEKGKQSASQKTPSFEQLHKKLIAAFADIKLVNQSSLSNGFLMKISPMVCFAVLIQLCKPDDVQTLTKLITYETNMTHSNKVCVSANISFVQMLSKIITRKDFNQISDILRYLQENFKGKSEDDVIGSAIQQAILSHANKDKDLMTADGRSAGFFKIAYYYTIYCFRQIATTCKSEQDLNRSDIYRNAIKMTIEQGGDTDTNACIVGAAVGSIIGFKNLPPQYLVKALSLKLGDSEFRKNQEFYDPANGFINLIKLIRKFM